MKTLEKFSSNIEGIEPSDKLIKMGKKHYPKLKIHNSTFEGFNTDKKYDLIFSIMVFNHCPKLEPIFEKLTDITHKISKIYKIHV